jgi:hypothetical protein
VWGNHGERDMERRKLLIGLGSLTAAGSAVIGTGAFTTAQSDRTVDVNVAAEESGSVGITGLNDTCASGTGDGELELDFDEDSGPGTFHGDAEDVNADSTSDFAEVFGIANTAGQGDARVIIEATESGDLASLNPTVDGEKTTAIDPGPPSGWLTTVMWITCRSSSSRTLLMWISKWERSPQTSSLGISAARSPSTSALEGTATSFRMFSASR